MAADSSGEGDAGASLYEMLGKLECWVDVALGRVAHEKEVVVVHGGGGGGWFPSLIFASIVENMILDFFYLVALSYLLFDNHNSLRK